MHCGIQQTNPAEIISLFFSVLAVYQTFLVKSQSQRHLEEHEKAEGNRYDG